MTIATTTERNKGLSIAKTFELEGVPETILTTGFAEEHTHTPMKDDGYVFRRETLRDLLAYLDKPRGDGLFFAGHYGTGKTSLPLQVAARLNWPVLSADGSEEFNVEDLIGRPDLQNGNVVFQYGALALAMKYGFIFMFNEIDSVPPGRLTAVHDVLEGRPLVIQSNGGEVINPHPNFRFVATGNSLGSGDTSGLYQGVGVLNIAFMDRFRVVAVDYPDEAIEMSILEKRTPEIPESVRHKMVKVANEVRRLFTGDSGVDSTLSITMSTRALCRWAELTVDYRNAGNPLEYALRLSLTSKAEPEQKEAIEELARSIFGDAWGGSL